MSLFDNRFERAAYVLSEADDEVLQSAGLMALMRLETLNRRMKGQPTRKALTPPQLPSSTVFPTPWWQKPPTTGFTFGYPQQNQGVFGAQSSTLFGSTNVAFGSQPANASQPQSQNTAFGSSQSTSGPLFGASLPPSQNTAFGSTSQTSSSTVFGAAQSTSQSTPGLFFGAPPIDTTAFGNQQPQNTTFGSTSQTVNTTPFGAVHPSPQSTPGLFFGGAILDTTAFGNQQPQSTSINTSFGFPDPINRSELQGKGEASKSVGSPPNPSQDTESSQVKSGEDAERKSVEIEK